MLKLEEQRAILTIKLRSGKGERALIKICCPLLKRLTASMREVQDCSEGTITMYSRRLTELWSSSAADSIAKTRPSWRLSLPG